MVSFCSLKLSFLYACTVTVFFPPGLLSVALRARRPLGAYRIPPETGLLIPSDKRDRVRRERRWSTAGVYPPGNWFAPPGSNQSSSGGNETAEASGAEGRNGDLPSAQTET